MARMFRAYRSSDVIGDFSGTQTVSDHARAITVASKHFIEIRKAETSEWVRYPVDYVIGSKWQQAYATRLPDQRLLVFPIQYSRLRSSWVNYWQIVDGPGSPRTDISQVSRGAGGRGVSDQLRRMPHEPVVVPGRRIATCGRDVPRGRHQLRDVSRSVRDHVERPAGGGTASRSASVESDPFSKACQPINTWRCARSATRSRRYTTRRRAVP